jgi:hypothetical protein
MMRSLKDNWIKWFGWVFAGLTIASVIGFIGCHIYANFTGIGPGARIPVKTRDGHVNIRHSKIDAAQTEIITSNKEIQWYDFIDHEYVAQYQTDHQSFFRSFQHQSDLKYALRKYTSASDYYSRFYRGLIIMDHEKITDVAKIFSDSAVRKKMSPLQVAEMIITFIQEIPYYLVHEGSCERAMDEGNSFLIQYHREGKPCLPYVAGGIQSPYGFLHNLKGDCDTRSLLAHAILRRLNIASSVWVSEAYGHSVLGVAVPAGYGIFKEVNGVRHYGVELTTKGYRIGMVYPEHANAENWNITIHN